MARAKEDVRNEAGLYERDYYVWVEEQVRLLCERRFDELDVDTLNDEFGDLGRNQKRSIRNNLVVVLLHLIKHRYQPRRRSRSWLASIEEHRRHLRKHFQDSPSLRGYARDEFIECYQDARQQAAIETGLPVERFPDQPPWTPEQTLDPDFLPE
jgi:hypothetical protein